MNWGASQPEERSCSVDLWSIEKTLELGCIQSLSTATPRPISRNMQWICKGHTIQHDHNSSITANFAHVKWDKVVNVDIRERRTRTAYTNICRSEEMISCLFECKAMCALVKVKWMFALVLWKCLCVCTLLFCASFWGSVRPWKSG